MEALTRDQLRAVDRRAIEHYGLHSLVLMENAGRGATDVLERLGIPGPVVVLCGRGNNGGDGFVIARHLLLRGYAVRVLVFDPPEAMSSDARTNYEILARSAAPLVHVDAARLEEVLAREFANAAWILDALLGTGARGAARPPYDVAIAHANRATAQRLAIDWPSGLDCDTGEPAGEAFRAAHTCTFAAPKRGGANPRAADYVGQLHVVDIGAPRQVIADVLGGETQVKK